jgi:hypothetical protein
MCVIHIFTCIGISQISISYLVVEKLIEVNFKYLLRSNYEHFMSDFSPLFFCFMAHFELLVFLSLGHFSYVMRVFPLLMQF